MIVYVLRREWILFCRIAIITDNCYKYRRTIAFLYTSLGNEIRRQYIHIYSNSSLISLATISKILFFFFSRRERNMLASPHSWEANRSSCPRAPLCMQIVCIFILLHSVYDNSSLSLCISLFSSFRRHFLEFSRQKQDERWRRRRRMELFDFISFLLLGKQVD